MNNFKNKICMYMWHHLLTKAKKRLFSEGIPDGPAYIHTQVTSKLYSHNAATALAT